MSDYVSNATVAQVATRILDAQRILITTHAKPDGDAMGSCLALVRGLEQKGKTTELYLVGPIEPPLRVIAGSTPFHHIQPQSDGSVDPADMPDDDFDLAIVVDTGAWAQLEVMAPWLRRHHEHVVGIDHHTRGDDVASMRLIDPKAVSTTAMLVPVLDEMQCDLTAGGPGGEGGVSEALFVGLATDSGWFRFPSAGADAFALAARLISCGVDKTRLYQILEETHGPQRLALEARALASIDYALNGSVAIQMLREQDFRETGASMEDLTGLVNTPLTVSTVRVSILLTQVTPGLTKVSFRSKAAPSGADASDFVDVNRLAEKFGGGGHVHAAGARIPMDIDQAKAAIIQALQANGVG